VAVDRLERWVTSLLTYLHPLKPHFSQHRLTDVADNALSLIELQLTDKAITLTRKGWMSEAKLLSLDTNLMEQTIFNLVQNAIEASPNGGRIVLHYRQHEAQAQLDISDEGRGMQFDPVAEQVTDGDTKRLSCGLGIPFALKVVKQHGGQLTYETAKETGTIVSIMLPTGTMSSL
jgi:K+-sensing histidine kinase KdpD